MTLKEFREKTKNLSEDTPIAVYLSNGDLDYASGAWIQPAEETEDNTLTIVVSGN